MPYTKKELETNTFYQNFVDNLQLNYLKELVEYSKTGFRKRGILYSFEDIVTTNGIVTLQNYAGEWATTPTSYTAFSTKAEGEA